MSKAEITITATIGIVSVIIGIILATNSAEPEIKSAVVQKQEIAFKNKACTDFMKKEGWFCEEGKTKTQYVYCTFKSVSGEKVTCQCFARVSVKCNGVLYFSLPEFNAKIKELKTAEKEEKDFEEDF